MNKARLSILFLVALTALSAQAQWRSVHAIKTTTATLTTGDGSVHKNTITSEYYRSTSGSELTVTVAKTPDGLLTKKIATLYDAEDMAQYSLDYGAKTAYLIERMPTAKPFKTGRGERHPELQHATYDGIDCVLLPIMLNGKQRVGTAWIDDKDDLQLKREIKLPGGITTTELSDITFDSKFDPSMFRLPSNFTINTSRIKTSLTQR